MDWLNYHHLFYFWTVAKEGSIAAATKTLQLSQPTISGQIRKLEESLGDKLFRKAGRGLELTDVGRTVFNYSNEIFSIGKELRDVLRGLPSSRPLRFAVGIVDVVPKLIAYQLLYPILKLPKSVSLVCYEGTSKRLLADLATHELDLVISDLPADPGIQGNVFNHHLGDTKIGVFGARSHLHPKKRFPASLDGAPFLFPVQGSALRRSLDQWFARHNIYPKVIGEFDDTALLKAFGERGAGLFAGALSPTKELSSFYKTQFLGDLKDLKESFYAISAERKIRHPAILTLFGLARRELF